MRLIDADELLKNIDDTVKAVTRNGHKEHITGLMISRYFTEHAPTIDPIKHGRWASDMAGNWCSVCGEISDCYYETNYCPNCGAKMDGDENG